MDDHALADAVNVKSQLTRISVDVRPQPDAYRARTGHSLDVETSRIYEELGKTQIYARDNGMKLNLSKTKLMLFNPCTSRDFMPEIALDNIRIDLVEETKLLGVVLTSDLSWAANTQYIVERCNSKIWT